MLGKVALGPMVAIAAAVCFGTLGTQVAGAASGSDKATAKRVLLAKGDVPKRWTVDTSDVGAFDKDTIRTQVLACAGIEPAKPVYSYTGPLYSSPTQDSTAYSTVRVYRSAKVAKQQMAVFSTKTDALKGCFEQVFAKLPAGEPPTEPTSTTAVVRTGVKTSKLENASALIANTYQDASGSGSVRLLLDFNRRDNAIVDVSVSGDDPTRVTRAVHTRLARTKLAAG